MTKCRELHRACRKAGLMSLLLFSASTLLAQGAKGSGQTTGTSGNAASQSAGAATAGGLPGLSWAQASWASALRFPPELKNTRLLCFQLEYTYSASQPFVLERIVPPDPPNPPVRVGGKDCSLLDEKHPLMMRERLVIGIDTSKVIFPERVKLLNINLTNQQGNPINPTPVRPSFAGGAPSTVTPLAPPRGPFFLTWPDRLPGDAIPTVSINAVYTPVAPGAPWDSHTLYPAGSVVVKQLNPDLTSHPNGHYYTALQGGISGTTPPEWPSDGPPTVPDRDPNVPALSWTDKGAIPADPKAPVPTGCGSAAKPWQPNTIYAAGTCVTSSNSHYWVAATTGVSWTKEEPFHLAVAGSVTEDTTLTWMDSGVGTPPSAAKQWVAGMPHMVGDVVTPLPPNGHFYTAIKGGTSGQGPVTFPVAKTDAVKESRVLLQVIDNAQVVWEFLSATPPKRIQGHDYRAGEVIGYFVAGAQHFYTSQQDCASGGQAVACKPGMMEPAFMGKDGEHVPDGEVVWIERGTTPDSVAWAPDHAYGPSAVVYSKTKKQFYHAVQSFTAQSGHGPDEPDFPQDETLAQVEWQDSGLVAPAAVASGQPADQTLNLLNLTLPQSHSISYFNLAAGVVYNSVRSPSFAVTNSVGVQIPGSHTVDPVLFLTGYVLGHWFPMDAERDWRPHDLIPGLSVGFSLANPTTHFYVGGSSEFFLRNVQLAYGASITQVSELTSTVPLNATTAATRQRFTGRWFVGLTFNVSGFVQGLFSAGKSSGS